MYCVKLPSGRRPMVILLLLLLGCLSLTHTSPPPPALTTAAAVVGGAAEALTIASSLRNAFYGHLYSGRTDLLLHQFSLLEQHHGTLQLPGDEHNYPSLYSLQGVLFFYVNRKLEAYEAFHKAVSLNPRDLRALINLVEVGRSYQHLMLDTMKIVERLSGRADRSHKASLADWSSFEMDQFVDIQNLQRCVYEHRDEDICDSELININVLLFPSLLWKDYLEFTAMCSERDRHQHLIQAACDREFETKKERGSDFSIYTKESCYKQQLEKLANQEKIAGSLVPNHDKIRVGVLLLKNDLNPVNILSFGLFKLLPRNRISLFAFFLNSQEHDVSMPWQRAFFDAFDVIVDLAGKDAVMATNIIRGNEIDILIEMNGISLNSGLSILISKPAPIQMSYLGDPMTSGTNFIDYYIGDPKSISVEYMTAFFTEKLTLLPTCYLANSHALSQQHILSSGRISRFEFSKQLGFPSKHVLSALSSSNTETIVVGAFHGWTKIDPTIFHVWMNIMRSSSNALLILQGNGEGEFGNLRKEMQAQGISPEHTGYIIPSQFDKHLFIKSGIDLYLDTTLKNGHTTTIDAQWSGLPTVALGGRDNMNSRSTESAVFYNENDYGVVYSLKEYEDFVVSLIKTKKGRERLKKWRSYSEEQRLNGALFNTDRFSHEFSHLLEAVYEARSGFREQKFNFFAVN